MTSTEIICPRCKIPLQHQSFNTEDMTPCPSCSTALHADVFPSFFKGAPVDVSPVASADTVESTCFFHPQRKAALTCGQCGRFICPLCAIDLDGGRICPSCFESGKRKKKMQTLENSRVLHDSIALGLATWPIIMWPFTIMTAPAALFYAIRYWKSPSSLIPRSKVRYVAAIALSLLQIAGWFILIYSLINYVFK